MEDVNYKAHINQIRQAYNVSGRRNIAFAEFEIGEHSDQLIAISGKDSPRGTVEVPTQPFFESFDVPNGHSRAYDSEYKILEQLASRYRQRPTIEGTVILYTERPPCASCRSVIEHFHRLFPNIILRVNHGGQTERVLIELAF